MNRYFLSAIMLFLSAVLMRAQTNNMLIDRIIRQLQMAPQEKTYVHTDAADYAPGDRIWLKVYVLNALSHEPVDESRYAYVELYGPDGRLTDRKRIICRDGVYAGYLDVPANAANGTYWLHSYTRLSQEVVKYKDVKPLYVGDVTARHKSSTKKDAKTSVAGSGLRYERTGKTIRVSTSLVGDSLMLLAHCRAYPFYLGKISRQQSVVFHSDSIPQGVVSLLLMNGQAEILAERLLFSDNGSELCRLQVAREMSDSLRLALSIADLHEGEQADISVAVTAAASQQRHRVSSIVDHMLLLSDVEEGVGRVGQRRGSQADVDSLLAGQRWTRYDMSRVLKGDFVVPKTIRETSQTIGGRVRTLLMRKPVEGATVSLISPQVGVAASALTDAAGKFYFPDMDFQEGTQYVLRAAKNTGNERVELVVEEQNFPLFSVPKMTATESVPEQVSSDEEHSATYARSIHLQNVDVTGTRRNSATKGNIFSEMSDMSFGLHQIEEMDATCLHEVLRHIPGVFVRDNRCYVRAATSIYGDNPAAIAIDGIIVDEEYDLDNIQMQDVARVDVFKTGTTVIWGSAGGSGVISITTKAGNYTEKEVDMPNIKRYTPLGYQRATPFALMPGAQQTLYWNPHVTSNRIAVCRADTFTGCRIVIEGVTTEGRLIHEEIELE